MDAKKVQIKDAKARESFSMFAFFKGVKKELKQITWTNKDELKTCTKVVVGATFFFGMLTYFFDVVLQSMLHFVGLLGRVFG